MPRTSPFVLAAALCLVAGAGQAERQMASNGLYAAGDASGFEVLSLPNRTGADYFCAAGTFARERLGARATDRVEIARPLGPSRVDPGRRAVTFVVTPPERQGFTFRDVVLSTKRTGQNRTVGHAVSLCNQTRDR
ncbi:hypothetical protein RM543_09080 [Roseicyclus sp. F158]|uniref:Uncharacterized protein n=1 Tax=Tropicimonas omnivorans TaxID=3075590 RepID=A0ABU3DGJ4_9RHOB|nr:hypothetical protein [Roseicyclus sp. F158]MDT0682837.1 hypothetical protein [Roseicyclus sp. F158]